MPFKTQNAPCVTALRDLVDEPGWNAATEVLSVECPTGAKGAYIVISSGEGLVNFTEVLFRAHDEEALAVPLSGDFCGGAGSRYEFLNVYDTVNASASSELNIDSAASKMIDGSEVGEAAQTSLNEGSSKKGAWLQVDLLSTFSVGWCKLHSFHEPLVTNPEHAK